MKNFFYILILTSLFISCKNKTESSKETPNNNIKILKPEYAKGFKIEYFKNKKTITIFNPWKKNEIYFTYIISKNSLPNKNNISNTKTTVINPDSLKKTAVLSGPQISMFYELNIQNKIKAVENKNFIYNPDIINKINKGEIYQIGGFNNFNYELCLNKDISAVFTSGWDKINENFNKISKAGIPVIYSLDWQETTPLGRAEWIKFIAAFFDKEQIADSIFNKIKNNYLRLKKTAIKAKNKPKVINGSIYNGTWYVAGGKSYVARLFNDANTIYPFSNDTHTGSIPLSFESVFLKAGDADFWLTSANNTDISFLLNDKRYSKLKAYKTKNIFLNSKRTNSTGGNDYWETGSIHPEYILKDIIKITHPELFPNYNLIFYTKGTIK